MKKNPFFLVLVIICVISISVNVSSYVNYRNAKKSFIFAIYSNLINVSTCLENLSHKSTDNLIYGLSSLEKTCLQLDASIDRLSSLSPHSRISYKFENFSILFINALNANDNSSESIANSITQPKEDVLELIRKLSLKEDLSYDIYVNLTENPDYSLSIQQIMNKINSTLVSLMGLER